MTKTYAEMNPKERRAVIRSTIIEVSSSRGLGRKWGFEGASESVESLKKEEQDFRSLFHTVAAINHVADWFARDPSKEGVEEISNFGRMLQKEVKRITKDTHAVEHAITALEFKLDTFELIVAALERRMKT